MLHLIYSDKAGRNFNSDPVVNCKALFKASEDSFTSSIFGLLLYLPAEKFWDIRLLFLYSKNRWKGEGHQGQEDYKDFHKIQALSANQEPTFLETHDNGDKFFVLVSIQLENLIDESTIKFDIEKFLEYLKTNNLHWAYESQRF